MPPDGWKEWWKKHGESFELSQKAKDQLAAMAKDKEAAKNATKLAEPDEKK